MKAASGDKVLIKGIGKRGLIRSAKGSTLIVIDEDDAMHSLSETELVNYSLAARKAWKKMPERQVGRPSGTTRSDRVSVTLRIDRDLWEAFTAAEQKELIGNRTQVINDWIRQKLHEHQMPLKKRGG